LETTDIQSVIMRIQNYGNNLKQHDGRIKINRIIFRCPKYYIFSTFRLSCFIRPFI